MQNTVCNKNHTVDSIKFKLITVSLLVTIFNNWFVCWCITTHYCNLLRCPVYRIFTSMTVSAPLTCYQQSLHQVSKLSNLEIILLTSKITRFCDSVKSNIFTPKMVYKKVHHSVLKSTTVLSAPVRDQSPSRIRFRYPVSPNAFFRVLLICC